MHAGISFEINTYRHNNARQELSDTYPAVIIQPHAGKLLSLQEIAIRHLPISAIVLHYPNHVRYECVFALFVVSEHISKSETQTVVVDFIIVVLINQPTHISGRNHIMVFNGQLKFRAAAKIPSLHR